MPHPIFKTIETDGQSNSIGRVTSTDIRVAQMTDLHIPGERTLSRRLRDLIRQYDTPLKLGHEMTAIYNELSHPFQYERAHYNRLIRKALIGLQRLDVDHLVISGDIGHCGIPAEFASFEAAVRATDWVEKMTLVPGNHDRFNLYEGYYDRRIEDFFDVVSPGEPRFREPLDGLGVFEIDSNRDPEEPLPDSERLLPNAMGSLADRELKLLEESLEAFEGNWFFVVLHHHISQDWYIKKTTNFGGLMAPLSEAERLVDVLSVDNRDFDIRILHGHRHVVMPIGYKYRSVSLGAPGAFFDHFRVNLFDLEDGQIRDSQIQLRRSAPL